LILTLEQALALRKGRRLVFTNGVFDLLHTGHVALLRHARSLGDLLIVGLNTDESVRRLAKGDERPWTTLEDRATVLAALRDVDGVVAFAEDTPCAIIDALKPEIHVKGGDYQAELLPEYGHVAAYGGRIEIVPLVEGRSTSKLLRRIGLE